MDFHIDFQITFWNRFPCGFHKYFHVEIHTDIFNRDVLYSRVIRRILYFVTIDNLPFAYGCNCKKLFVLFILNTLFLRRMLDSSFLKFFHRDRTMLRKIPYYIHFNCTVPFAVIFIQERAVKARAL